MKKAILGFVLISQLTGPWALGLEVLQQPGKIILNFPKCSDRKPQVEKFGSCSKKISKGLFTAGCELEISNCVEHVYVQLHGVKALVNGLNDYNAALHVAGVVPVLRHSPLEEFSYFIHSPLCRKLETSENPQPRDIGTAFDSDGDIVGAVSFVRDGLVFTKMDPRTLQFYVTLDQDDYKKKISQDEEKTISYYRCEPLEKKHPAPWQEELNQVENEIAHPLPVKVSMSADKSTILLERFRHLIAAYRQASGFLQGALRARLIGIREHLRENAKSVSESEREAKAPIIEFLTVELEKPLSTSSKAKPLKNETPAKSNKPLK